MCRFRSMARPRPNGIDSCMQCWRTSGRGRRSAKAMRFARTGRLRKITRVVDADPEDESLLSKGEGRSIARCLSRQSRVFNRSPWCESSARARPLEAATLVIARCSRVLPGRPPVRAYSQDACCRPPGRCRSAWDRSRSDPLRSDDSRSDRARADRRTDRSSDTR